MKARILAVLALAALLPACKLVGPDYVRPTANVPPTYKDTGGTWKTAQPLDALPRGKWWELFEDPQLNALAERVEGGNQNIRQAEARYRQAQAALRQVQADRYPFVTGGAAAGRSRIFSGSSGTGGRTSSGSTSASSSFELGVDASWEPDLWGRVRRSVEAGEAQAQAAAADLESVKLSAVATLVEAYIALRVIDAQARLLQETVAAYSRSLQLTRNRYAGGIAAKADVVQAEVQLKSNQAQLVDLDVTRARLEHAIAVLIGEPPSALAIAPAPLAAKLPAIPSGLPSELLQRRPDIASAERNVAAANARIGVAQSALYPSVMLSGGLGLRSTTLPELISSPTLFWALGASALQILFDGGRLQAVADQARAAYEAEVAFYRQTVLASFQEVEDNLATLRILEEEAKLQADAVAAARQSVALTENRYKAGIASFLEVIVVQTIALSNERTEVGILGRRLAAAVQLIKAVGGGWDARSLEHVQVGRVEEERQ